MTFGELYDIAIRIGVEKDPRGKVGIDCHLAALKRLYDELTTTEQEAFDTERLTNPFGDTRIVVGNRDSEFDCILTGIHFGKPEVLLAGQLRLSGRRRAIVSHHTSMFAARARASVEDTVSPMAHRLEMVGVDPTRAAQLAEDFWRQKEADYQSAVADITTLQIAEGLAVPIISIHTPCDLCHQEETIHAMTTSDTLGEAVSLLSNIREWAHSARIGQPIAILSGGRDTPVGKPFFSQAVGWRPPLGSGIWEAAIDAGADTLVVTEAPPDIVEYARSRGASVVSMPHDMTDVRGMRLLYDMVFEGKGIEVLPCSKYVHL